MKNGPMKKDTRLVISIYHSCYILFTIQILFFSILHAIQVYPLLYVFLFYFLAVLFHFGLAVLLIKTRSLFETVPEHVKLDRVNIPNLLTIIRLSSIPTIFVLILLSRSYRLLPVLITFVSIVFLTDLLDGFISRQTRQITKIGKALDSFSDYSVLLVITVVFRIFKILPLWFFILILLRIFLMGFGMLIVARIRGYLKPETTILGKASIFSTMVLYAFSLLFEYLKKGDGPPLFIVVLQILTAAIITASIIDKIINLRRSYLESKTERSGNLS